MPRVPVYEQRVQAQSAAAPAPSISRPPAEAFGVGQGQAIARLGSAAQSLGDQVAKTLIDQKLREDERAVVERDTAARKELQSLLYNPEEDENRKPKGFLSRQLGHATDITPEFDQAYGDLKKRYLDTVESDAQKYHLGRLLDNQYESARSGVIRHEAEQRREAYRSSLNSNLEQRVLGAGSMSNPELLGKALVEAREFQASGMRRMGADDASIQVAGEKLASEMTAKAFEPVLAQDAKKARALLEGVKGNLPASVVAKMEQALSGKELDDQRQAVWSQVSRLTLSDGNPDEAKMQEAVLGLPGMSTEKKEKIWDYVKARAGEARQQRKAAEAATDHSFANEVYEAKRSGLPMDKALELVGKYGGDNVAQADRAKIVQGIYTKDVKTDPATFVEIWEGIQEGRIGKVELGQAFSQDRLSAADYRSLTELKYNTVHKEDEFYKKEMVDHIKDLAKSEYGSNDKKRGEFIYSVLVNSRGKSPEETWKIANDLLKKDPASGWLFKDEQWKTDIKNRDASAAVWGTLHSDLGRDQVKAIGQGALYGGKKNWGVTDVEAFANAFGGYDKIKQGTPANAAIQSLIRKRKVVTPDSVRAVLKAHPDGVWR